VLEYRLNGEDSNKGKRKMQPIIGSNWGGRYRDGIVWSIRYGI
jgi:hypothetical protein